MRINKIMYIIILFIAVFTLGACKKKDEDSNKKSVNKKSVVFNFQAKANGMSDFMNGMIMFQNAKGNKFGVTKLKYLVSDIILHKTDGTTIHINGYHFVNVNDEQTLSYTPSTKITAGSYDYIQLVFGLTPENNKPNSHQDLNVLSWNWPDMMGGGYHFMQLEGKYITNTDDTTSYQTHLGATIDPNNTSDTLNNDITIKMNKNFVVSDASSVVSIPIIMNIDQWYENPHTIDLNQYGAAIMGNYQAQMLFHDNGAQGVFTLGSISSN